MTTVCPQCRNQDMIQKVSAAYSAGVANSSYVGNSTTIRGISQTPLSSTLAPPSKPVKEVIRQMSSWHDSLLVGGSTVIGFFAWLIGGLWSYIIAAVLIIIIMFFLWLPSYNRRKKEAEEKYNQADARFQIAIEKWNRVYYCARDDIVFDPQDGRFTSAVRMNDLLYR